MPEDTLLIDVRGMLCPMPALVARKRLKNFTGMVVHILASDPMAELDIGLIARERGMAMVMEQKPDGSLWFELSAAD